MKRKRFTEEQIITVLREHEAGAKAADLPFYGIFECMLVAHDPVVLNDRSRRPCRCCCGAQEADARVGLAVPLARTGDREAGPVSVSMHPSRPIALQ